jgi:class 3 adenylate cyclase
MNTLAISIGHRTFTLKVGTNHVKIENPDGHGYPLPGKASFWDVLSRAERRAFSAVAIERSFAAGAKLMQEGEQADYVIVVLKGRTKVCVREKGGEMTIAERGPGQLIGERAALRVSVRSATVTALETVQALVMKTGDFAAFVTAHPAVLGVVEDQVYDRLTERSASLEPYRPYPLHGENCTVLFTDVVAFGAPPRTDEDRRIIREAILGMTRTALDGLWGECVAEDRGDGHLIVVPPRIPTTQVVERLLNGLPQQLRRHNHIYGESVRIRLRVAVNVGPVVSDAMGMSGEAIIRTARLLDAPALKKGIEKSGANLGLIVSSFVYETTIKHGAGSIDPDGYGQVQVNVKETRLTAWMKLVDPVPPVYVLSYRD